MRHLARRLLPDGFGGQVAAIVLVGFALSQVFAGILYVGLLPRWERMLRPDAAIAKMDVAVRLIESLTPAERPAAADILAEDRFHVSYVDGPTASAAPRDGARTSADDEDLRRQLAAKLGKPLPQVHVTARPTGSSSATKRVEVALRDGGTLVLESAIGEEHRLGLVEQAALAVFLLLVLAGLGAWLAWMVNAPLTRFARAAERVGTDIDAEPIPEQGPRELRRVIRTFNEMQARVQRTLQDRTRMLAAISHDLRTPLTRIRLRLETGRAAGESGKIVSDIDRMERMLTSTLAFVRGVDAAEASETVDLDLLLQTACDLISDVGGSVRYEGPGRCRLACRPQSLMRAITNVVANAAKYGSEARVALAHAPAGFLITIADDGPGIAPAERERVFEPFYRGELGQATDSEGMGLGLAIARSIVLAHGGTIELDSPPGGGLVVRIALPIPTGS